MKDWNSVFLSGRLTRDPETRTFDNGNTRAVFTLAVNRGKDKGGTEKTPYFIRCQAWRKTAENIGRYCRKGRHLTIAGTIFANRVAGDDGDDRYFYGVNVTEFRLAPDGRQRDSGEPPDEVKDTAKFFGGGAWPSGDGVPS